jgi:hypothetical protein
VAHPVHSLLPENAEGKYPAAFRVSESIINFLGQKEMQISQPLQSSRSISIFPFT